MEGFFAYSILRCHARSCFLRCPLKIQLPAFVVTNQQTNDLSIRAPAAPNSPLLHTRRGLLAALLLAACPSLGVQHVEHKRERHDHRGENGQGQQHHGGALVGGHGRQRALKAVHRRGFLPCGTNVVGCTTLGEAGRGRDLGGQWLGHHKRDSVEQHFCFFGAVLEGHYRRARARVENLDGSLLEVADGGLDGDGDRLVGDPLAKLAQPLTVRAHRQVRLGQADVHLGLQLAHVLFQVHHLVATLLVRV
mmetsp:Transcript_34846/g.71162  ORF Transcript_34846/g.71162 Transcript_34846/m.71162 type:complete len:249 (-) Transcript_34846:1282-2028(-)